MLVPVSLIAERLSVGIEEVNEKVGKLCPVVRGMVYYQYLPEEVAKKLAAPLDKLAEKPATERRIAHKRYELLINWHLWIMDRGMRENEDLWTEFCREVGSAAAVGRGGKIPQWSQAKAWWRKYLERGLAGLCQSSPGASKAGGTSLSSGQQQMLVSILYHPDPQQRRPHLSIKVLRDYLIAESTSGEKVPSASAIEKWLKTWRTDNRVLVETMVNPDRARGCWAAKVGSLSEDVTRLNQRWELDGTKLDIMCADGKRYSIAVVIDIYSRRAKCHLSKTSTSAALSLLVRDCIADWGVPEQVVCDNGKDYVSDAMMALWSQLGVDTHVLPPFFPAGKPHVESFNRKLARRAELWPGYIGHNVADRKDIESRLSFSDRMSGEVVIRAGYTPEQAQAAINDWLRDEYHHEKHSSLGVSPEQRAKDYQGEVRRISSVRALDILLEPIAGSRMFRNGYIELDGGKYVPEPPEAMPKMGLPVAVRRGADYGVVYLYELAGKFICEAVDITRLGARRQAVAVKIKQVAAEQLAGDMKGLRKMVKSQAARDVNEAIAEAAKKRRLAAEAGAAQAKVLTPNFRQRVVEHSTPALIEANRAAEVTDARRAASPAVAATSIIIDDPAIVFTPPPLVAGDYDPLLEAWNKLDAMMKDGKPLCDDALAFYANLQTTPIFRAMRRMAV